MDNSSPVVILGMHRSGTSFLIRALNLSGLWLGADAALSTIEGRAKSGNPKGNYEHREAIALNDALLTRSGGSWLSPPRQLVSHPDDGRRIQILCESLQLSRPPQYPRWGWKDPRTLLTLEVWLRALGRPVCVVASFRHPTAVAQSLLARNGLPLPLGYALWTYYNTLMLRYLDLLPHTLVRFDVPPDRVVAQTVLACDNLGLLADAARIASWHDPELVRSAAAGDDVPDDANVAAVWRALLERHRACSAANSPSPGT